MNSKLPPHSESDEDEYEDEKGIPSLGPNINNNGQQNKNREEVDLSPYDPNRPHRSVSPGLNFEGKCENPACKVNGKMVWVPLGYGNMLYAKLLFKCPCPICKKMLNKNSIKNIGFRNARVKFEGRKANEEQIQYDDEEREGKLIMFKGQKDDEQVGWLYLYIQVQKI